MKVDDDRDCDLVNEHVPSHIERIDTCTKLCKVYCDATEVHSNSLPMCVSGPATWESDRPGRFKVFDRGGIVVRTEAEAVTASTATAAGSRDGGRRRRPNREIRLSDRDLQLESTAVLARLRCDQDGRADDVGGRSVLNVAVDRSDWSIVVLCKNSGAVGVEQGHGGVLDVARTATERKVRTGQ